MKQPTFTGRELLPLSVMEAAHAGDAMAIFYYTTGASSQL